MKKLIALLSISAFIGGCVKEPTQLEKCIDINSKKIIAEMKKNYEEFPESVLYSRVESNKDFDEEHAKKQYPLVLKQSLAIFAESAVPLFFNRLRIITG